jgi:hypothetical protein
MFNRSTNRNFSEKLDSSAAIQWLTLSQRVLLMP